MRGNFVENIRLLREFRINTLMYEAEGSLLRRYESLLEIIRMNTAEVVILPKIALLWESRQ